MRGWEARGKVERITAQVRDGDTPAKIDGLYLFGPHATGDSQPPFIGIGLEVDYQDEYTVALAIDRSAHSDEMERRLRGGPFTIRTDECGVVLAFVGIASL